MLIDWFTVVAQIVNFLILVALLKRFLWKRLVVAIDQRENRIAAQLAECDRKSTEVDRLLTAMRVQSEDQERQRSEMIASAQHEAEDRRNQIIQRAREEAHGFEARWRQELEREQTAFLEEARQRTVDLILILLRRALADLASADIQRATVSVFLEKLQTLEATALRDLASREISVLSPDELPEETRKQIQSVLKERLGTPVHLQFVRLPAMGWGIELRSDGRRIGWTPDSYLDSLEEKLREALEHRAKPSAELSAA